MDGNLVVGVIGGSGFYEISGFEVEETRRIDTPFGAPSDEFVITSYKGAKVVFLPRHGRGHVLNPSEVNYRANVYAMKLLGADVLISVSAVGSLREHLSPGHIVLPDQFFDRTKGIRKSTFFEKGIVAHVPFADPVSAMLQERLFDAAMKQNIIAHRGGTYVCIEGPQFSTRAESLYYRSIGADIIGMTNLTEAKLAREAEIAYASICLVTDYDCWRSRDEDVDVAEILQIMAQNVENAKRIIKEAIPSLVENPVDPPQVLEFGILTDRTKIPEQIRRDLEPIIGKYVK